MTINEIKNKIIKSIHNINKTYETNEIIEYDITNKDLISNSLTIMIDKNKSFLSKENDDEYNRTLFLHKIGFHKLERVKKFIMNMDIIGNIKEYQKICRKYSKYKLDIINIDMLNILTKEYSLVKEYSSKFNSYLPNKAIDDLKINYELLEKDCLIFNVQNKYYESDSYQDVLNIETINNFIIYKKSDIISCKENILYNSYYWKCIRKDIIVCSNNNIGLILLEIENKHFIILSEWHDNKDKSLLSKISFKEFIHINESKNEEFSL